MTTHAILPLDILNALHHHQPLDDPQTQILLTTSLDKLINHIDVPFAEMRGVMLAIRLVWQARLDFACQ